MLGAETCWWPVSLGQTCFSCLVCCYWQQAREVSPLPPILAAVWAVYFKEEGEKKKPSRIFPLYALILGRRCPQHAPISWWAPVLERQEMTAGLWPSRGDQTPGQVGGKRWTLPGETWVMVPAGVSHRRSSLSLSALPR